MTAEAVRVARFRPVLIFTLVALWVGCGLLDPNDEPSVDLIPRIYFLPSEVEASVGVLVGTSLYIENFPDSIVGFSLVIEYQSTWLSFDSTNSFTFSPDIPSSTITFSQIDYVNEDIGISLIDQGGTSPLPADLQIGTIHATGLKPGSPSLSIADYIFYNSTGAEVIIGDLKTNSARIRLR